MIASLNIVAKKFAKIAKMFVGLSATIIATRRRCITNYSNDISDDVYKVISGNGENGS